MRLCWGWWKSVRPWQPGRAELMWTGEEAQPRGVGEAGRGPRRKMALGHLGWALGLANMKAGSTGHFPCQQPNG